MVGGRHHQLLDVVGRRRRLEVGTDDPAHGMDGGAPAVDEDSQVAGGYRRHRDHGAARRRFRRERERIAAEEDTSGQRRLGRDLGADGRILGVLGDQDRVGPGPGADGRPCCSPQRRGSLTEKGQDVARLERDQPGAFRVVADREDDRQVGKGEVVDVEGTVRHVPGRVVPHGHETRRRWAGHFAGQAERDARRRDTDGPDPGPGARSLQGQPEEAVGGLEGVERRDTGEAVQEGGGVQGPVGRGRSDAELPREARTHAAPVPRPPGQRGTGERAQAQSNEFRQVPRPLRARRVGGRAARGASVSAARASAGSRRCQPARSWSGSTNRMPPPMSRPRLSAASTVHSAPSPR